MSGLSGTIFNIQRFSIHDGPGIRTTVFFKGCNLDCKWCHNPESKGFERELEFYPERCTGCGNCREVCPTGAHQWNKEGIHSIAREKCNGCSNCVAVCYFGAIAGVGRRVDSEYVINSVMTDKLYYQNSSGGVTFSGGECMLQLEFLTELLMRLNVEGIHTAVDTAGHVPWASFEGILKYTDLFLYDIKAEQEELHRQLTDRGNTLIWKNLEKLSLAGKRIYVRIPLIASGNEDEIGRIAERLKKLEIEKVEVIPYHRLGVSKYTALGLQYEWSDGQIPTEQQVELALNRLRSTGLKAERT